MPAIDERHGRSWYFGLQGGAMVLVVQNRIMAAEQDADGDADRWVSFHHARQIVVDAHEIRRGGEEMSRSQREKTARRRVKIRGSRIGREDLLQNLGTRGNGDR